MSLWDTLIDAGADLHTYELLALTFATILLIRLAKAPHRETIRFLLGVCAMHVMAWVAAVYLGHHGPDRTLGFVALALSSCGMAVAVVAAVFRVFLPYIGVTLPRILIDILTAVGIIATLIYTGQRAGFSVTGLITTSAVLTAVIGFALQDTLGNIMGGLALQMDNSVRLNDWISLGPGQPAGRVSEIRWRYTAIETRGWETIIIPNALFMKHAVTVYGRRQGQPEYLRRQIDFFVDFRTPAATVIDVVTRALRNDPVASVATEPAPHVLFLGVRDSVIHYAVRFWLSDLAQDDPVDSDVRVRVFYSLERAGIPPAIPAQALFVTQESAERSAAKHASYLATRLALLQRNELFASLTDDALMRLAPHLHRVRFAAGETIAREGAMDEGVFLIDRGTVSIRISAGSGLGSPFREVRQLGAGRFFGEMSLMTGAPRQASVVALTHLECYRIDREDFETTLREHPQIAEHIAEVFANRKVELEAARDGLTDSMRSRRAETKNDFLHRLRGLLGLQ